MHKQSQAGTPLLNLIIFTYLHDSNTFAVHLQLFYGDSTSVSPVTAEDFTSVEIYLPNDLFDDFYTYTPVQGKGAKVNITDIDFTDIPLPAYTTTGVRKQPFSIFFAPNSKGEATGSLYLDDGVSLEQEQTSDIQMEYKVQVLSVSGKLQLHFREQQPLGGGCARCRYCTKGSLLHEGHE